MLTHPTLDQLHALGLHGMAKAFVDIEAGGEAASLGHAEWLALLLEREASLRRDKRLSKRLQYAKLRQQACVEDIDYRTPRGLDRSLFAMLVEGSWIDDHANLLICGPSGVGKSWLASALGNKACRDNRSALYQRVPRLFTDLALARGDGRHPRLLRALGRVDLLILDDWGLEPLDAAARHDLLEILEDRYGHRSTIVTSQLPVDQWHALIGDPTYADAVLDRLVHNTHRIDLSGRACGEAANPAERPEPVALWTCRCAWTTRSALPTCPQQEQQKTSPSSRDSRLTTRLRRCQKPNSQNASRPGRHQIGMVGEIISESWARSNRYTRARSSESAA
ncbi:ATP-binding protein [Bradyrhizobium elkanii]